MKRFFLPRPTPARVTATAVAHIAAAPNAAAFPGVMCTAAMLACAMPVLAIAQSASIPVRTLTVPALSKETFAQRPTVRHLPNGNILVDDRSGRRLIVFDSTLATFTISADSLSTNGSMYPRVLFANPLLPYPGDSTLWWDFEARALLMIDPSGKIARPLAHPAPGDLLNVSTPFAGRGGTDKLGRLIYRAGSRGMPVTPKAGDPPDLSTRDSIKLVRADFNTRTVDTIAMYTVPKVRNMELTTDANGKTLGKVLVNPVLKSPDEYAVMSDGTVAIVREQDYHVDFYAPDGKTSSSSKLPFDWMRLTDAMKQAKIDSAKRMIDSVNSAGGAHYGAMYRSRRVDEGRTIRDTIAPSVYFPKLDEMADYLSPIRQGALTADEDNNLWILPTTSAAGGVGVVYDMVNRKGELFQRVRLPEGFVLVGHGKGDIVIIAKVDAATKRWTLGRARIANGRPAGAH